MSVVTSPLKVRERKGRVWAEDASGTVVIDGRNRNVHPDQFVCEAFGGTWRVQGQQVGEAYLAVLDPTGQEVARIASQGKRQPSLLQLPNGDSAEIEGKGGGMIIPPRCEIAGWATAVAPRFAPQRYFTLTFTDAALAHPSASAIAVVAVWQGETKIATAIIENAGE
jgi:hypothetical protein